MLKIQEKRTWRSSKKKGKKIEKFKSEKGSNTGGKGQGKKLGTAYQLENGEIIYIPED